MAKDTRRVLRGIGVTENDKHRVETDPDVIAGMYSQSALDALVESGVLAADNPREWVSTKADEAAHEGDEQESSDDKTVKSSKKKGKLNGSSQRHRLPGKPDH